MFILDDLILAPFKGFHWLAKQIHNAVLEEVDAHTENVTEQLQNLYRMLERGEISEEEFDLQESVLLDQLEAFETDPDEEKNTIQAQLQELYMMKEVGQLSQEDYERQTQALQTRLKSL